jgi:hypothetical protein
MQWKYSQKACAIVMKSRWHQISSSSLPNLCFVTTCDDLQKFWNPLLSFFYEDPNAHWHASAFAYLSADEMQCLRKCFSCALFSQVTVSDVYVYMNWFLYSHQICIHFASQMFMFSSMSNIFLSLVFKFTVPKRHLKWGFHCIILQPHPQFHCMQCLHTVNGKN